MQLMNATLHAAQTNQVGSKASPQLRQAADEFEASFLQELLKPLSEDAMFGADSSGEPSGSMGTVSSIAAQALADGIAKSGGLGIAKRVLAELTPVEAAESSKAGIATGTKCGGCMPHLGPIENVDAAGAGTEGAVQTSVGVIAEASGAGISSGVEKGAPTLNTGRTAGQKFNKMVHLLKEMH